MDAYDQEKAGFSITAIKMEFLVGIKCNRRLVAPIRGGGIATVGHNYMG